MQIISYKILILLLIWLITINFDLELYKWSMFLYDTFEYLAIVVPIL
jgi:hypothetical protein